MTIHYFNGGEIELEHAQFLAWEYKRLQRDQGCTCFLCAPCGLCTHEGHPCSMEIMGLDEDGYPLDMIIEVDDVITHREMLAMDAEPLKSTDNMGVSKPVVDEWIKRENEFTEKQQAKQEAEAQKEQAKAEQMAQAGEVFSREYDNKHDHRMGFGHG